MGISDRYRCAYCHRDWFGRIFQWDHVIPRSQGGNDDQRVWSCPECNLRKGTSTAADDPWNGRRSQLFNPLSQRWDQHFLLSRTGLLRGRTSAGRATAALLTRPTPQYMPHKATADENWGPLASITEEGLVLASQALRGYLNMSRFDLAAGELAVLRSLTEEWRPTERWFISFLADFYTAVSYLNQPTHDSHLDALRFGLRMLRLPPASDPHVARFRIDYTATVARQMASYIETRGEVDASIPYWNLSAEVYARIAVGPLRDTCKYLLREELDRARVACRAPTPPPPHIVEAAIAEASEEDWQALGFLVDFAVAGVRLPGLDPATLLSLVEEEMTRSGYRQNGDPGQSVCLRRRWIALSTVLGALDDLTVLERDLQYWLGLRFEHEARELLRQLSISPIPAARDSRRFIMDVLLRR